MKHSIGSENCQILAVLICICEHCPVDKLRIRLQSEQRSVLHIGEPVKVLPVVVDELVVDGKLLSIVREGMDCLRFLPLNVREVTVRYDTSALHIPDISV